jgi:hypothetical protein
MLKYWPDNPQTKGKKKQQMFKYCCFIWIQGPILKLSIFWPKFEADEDWVCQLLFEYVKDKSFVSQEETVYALCWRQSCGSLSLNIRKGRQNQAEGNLLQVRPCFLFISPLKPRGLSFSDGIPRLGLRLQSRASGGPVQAPFLALK